MSRAVIFSIKKQGIGETRRVSLLLYCLRGALVPTFRLAHSVTRPQAVAPLPLRSVVLDAMGGIKNAPYTPKQF